MTTHHGNLGVVKLSSNAVAEVTAWTIRSQANLADDTAMGDTWKTMLGGGASEWSGQLSCHFDPGDTNGQAVLTEGASVTLNLYPYGTTAGNKYWTGTAIVQNIERKGSKDTVIDVDFDFVGSGALTLATA
jgi:hypothetical protein